MWYFDSNVNPNPKRNSETAVFLLQAVPALSDPGIAGSQSQMFALKQGRISEVLARFGATNV